MNALIPDFLEVVDRVALRDRLWTAYSIPDAIKAQIRSQFVAGAPTPAGITTERDSLDEDLEDRQSALQELLEGHSHYLDYELAGLFDLSCVMSSSGPPTSMTAYRTAWHVAAFDDGRGVIVEETDSDYVMDDQFAVVARYEPPTTLEDAVGDLFVETFAEWMGVNASQDVVWVCLRGTSLNGVLDRIVGRSPEQYGAALIAALDSHSWVTLEELQAEVERDPDLAGEASAALLTQIYGRRALPEVLPPGALDVLRAAYWTTWTSE